MADPLAESHVAEAANAAAVHEQARQKAFQQTLVEALQDVLTTGHEGDKLMLLQRVPFICQDIKDIRNDLRWIKYLGGGFLMAAGLLALKTLGI